MRRTMQSLCALSVLVAVSWGQAPPDKAKWPIHGIAIRGNHLYSAEQLRAATGLKLNQPANQADFEAARDRLLATGVLETVAFEFGPSRRGGGYDVAFEVAEIQQVYPYRFERIKAGDEELRACLRRDDPLFTDQLPGTDMLIERYAGFIEKCLAEKGEEEPIRGELTSDVPGEFYIMFYPKAAMPVVAEVTFTGNEVIPTERLQEAIHGVAIGSRYTEGRFRALLAAGIRQVYEARGRVGVTFPKIETERASGGISGVRVVVTVDEGESYSFDDIVVEGTLSMDERLRQAAALTTGDVANMTELRNALDRIKAELHKDGYMDATAREEHKIDHNAKTVGVRIFVEPGPQFRFGELFVEGLDIHAAHEVRRIWGLEKGAQFDARYPEYFLQRIREDGVFDNIRKTAHELGIHKDTLTVDVKLIFNPPETGPRVGGLPRPPSRPGQTPPN